MTVQKSNQSRQTQKTLMALMLVGFVLQTNELFGQTKKENVASTDKPSVAQIDKVESWSDVRQSPSVSSKSNILEMANSSVDRMIKRIKGIKKKQNYQLENRVTETQYMHEQGVVSKLQNLDNKLIEYQISTPNETRYYDCWDHSMSRSLAMGNLYIQQDSASNFVYLAKNGHGQNLSITDFEALYGPIDNYFAPSKGVFAHVMNKLNEQFNQSMKTPSFAQTVDALNARIHLKGADRSF